MRFLIDMDGVLADFDARLVAELEDAGYPNVDEWVTHRPYFEFGPVDDILVRTVMKQPGFFRSLAPVVHAIEALREMVAEGHEVFLVTSPLSNSDHCIPEKIEWVKRHLGEDWLRRLVITKDKTIVRGDLLVEDNPEPNGVDARPAWNLVMFDRSYNRRCAHPALVGRLHSWRNWRDLLDMKKHRIGPKCRLRATQVPIRDVTDERQ